MYKEIKKEINLVPTAKQPWRNLDYSKSLSQSIAELLV